MDQMDQRLFVWGFAAPIPESNDLLSGADNEPSEHYHDSVLRDASNASGRQTAADCHQSIPFGQEGDASREPHSRDEVDDWFNLSAFETEPSHNVDADGEVQAPSNSKESSLSRRQNRQASNREHQRRWRIRQKVKFNTARTHSVGQLSLHASMGTKSVSLRYLHSVGTISVSAEAALHCSY